MLRTALCALGLWLALSMSPALAQTKDQADARSVAALQSLAKQADPYNTLISDALEMFDEVASRVGQTADLATKQTSPAEAKRWLDSWLLQDRKRVETLQRRLKALPPIDLTELSKVVPENDPNMRSVTQQMKLLPSWVKSQIELATDLLDLMEKQAPAAATGDEKALRRLGMVTFEIAGAGIARENQTIQIAIDSLAPDHPQRYVSMATLASNKAMQQYLQAAMDELAEKPSSEGSGRRVVVLAEESKEAGRKAGPAANALVAAMKSDLEGTELWARLQPALLGYEKATQVEVAIADHLAAVGKIMADDSAFADEIQTHLDAITTLVNERVRLSQERSKLFAQ